MEQAMAARDIMTDPTIINALDDLHDENARLRETVSILLDRLNPVLRPQGPVEALAGEKDIPTSAPLFDSITQVNRQAYRTRLMVEDMLSRLQLP